MAALQPGNRVAGWKRVVRAGTGHTGQNDTHQTKPNRIKPSPPTHPSLPPHPCVYSFFGEVSRCDLRNGTGTGCCNRCSSNPRGWHSFRARPRLPFFLRLPLHIIIGSVASLPCLHILQALGVTSDPSVLGLLGVFAGLLTAFAGMLAPRHALQERVLKEELRPSLF